MPEAPNAGLCVGDPEPAPNVNRLWAGIPHAPNALCHATTRWHERTAYGAAGH